MTTPNPPDGVIDGARHLYAVRVYYEDTDLSGVVYHANYLRWFERARSDLLRRLAIDQRSAIETGEGAYAVSELALRYLRPARLGDDILIETRCTALGRHPAAWRNARRGRGSRWPRRACASASSRLTAVRAANPPPGAPPLPLS